MTDKEKKGSKTLQKLNPQSYADFIWAIKEIIRDAYADKEVEEVILPFTLLRRLDCVLEGTEEKVKAENEKYKAVPAETRAKILQKAAGQSFYNTSGLSLAKIVSKPSADNAELDENFNAYLNGFSANIKDILYNFSGGEEKGLDPIYKTLLRKNLLYSVVNEFVGVDLHPETVNNHDMGTVFEVLIRYAKETTAEKAGQYYTPREIVNLMARLVFATEAEKLQQTGKGIQIYDPCCGTGGMLTVAKDYLLEHVNPKLDVFLYGQELYEKTYAIAKSDLLMKGENAEYIKQGDTLTHDQHNNRQFDYMLTNPPFGDDWKNIRGTIEAEHERGFSGRFGAGLPDVSDGSLLFLQHMIDKWNPDGGVIGIVFNGSPLFNGDAGGGWSNIRGWILENDWLDTIVSLPKDLFYGTGIGTYIWILNNNKTAERRGKVLLINAVHTAHFAKKIKSLGKKQYEVSETGIQRIVELYRDFRAETITSELTKKQIPLTEVKDMTDFKYRKVTVERPLRLSYPPITDEGIAQVEDSNAFKAALKKSPDDAASLMFILHAAKDEGFSADNDAYWFAEMTHRFGAKMPAPFIKLLRDTFGARDENAPEVFASPYTTPKDFAKETNRWHHTAKAGKELPLADSELRDTENIPWKRDVEDYFQKEVLPFAPDAWMDRKKDKTGYEIPFTKYFYEYKPLRPLDALMADIEALEEETEQLLEQIKTDISV